MSDEFKVISIGSAGGPIEAEGITEFLDVVFHGLPSEGEDAGEVVVWCAKPGKPPFLPISETELGERFKRGNAKRQCYYYGTASVGRDDEGTLRNKQELFKRLHVVVLDDVGTKVAPAKLPPEFQNPSYIIESSQGNYQYGLVLAEPIADLSHAEALIQLVYESGCSDAGGKMPNKLVRLPCGVNGKEGKKGEFEVRLESISDRRYTPEEILTACGAGTSWESITSGEYEGVKKYSARGLGAQAWKPLEGAVLTNDGATDVVLSWLEKNKNIKSDNGEWVACKCPWSHEHTNGDALAGYSPLGFGEGKFRYLRGFNCFHDHCKNRTAADVIDFLVEREQIPLVPVYDPVWTWRKRFVFEATSNCWLDLEGEQPYENRITTQSLRTAFAEKVKVGKKTVFKASLLADSCEKIVINGNRYEPGGSTPLIELDGELFYNAWQPPGHDLIARPEDAGYVELFLAAFRWTWPNNDAQAFILDHVAGLIQNPRYRGPAVLSIAAGTYGTGRDSFFRCLSSMFGERNCNTVELNQLLDEYDTPGNRLVHVSEALDTSDRMARYTKTFEKFKSLIDPMPISREWNPKYGKRFTAPDFRAFFISTNAENALTLPSGDRRFYVARNNRQPMPKTTARALHAVISSGDRVKEKAFGAALYRFFQAREVDTVAMSGCVARHAAKDEMETMDGGLPLEILRGLEAVFGGSCLPIHVLKSCGALDEIICRQVGDSLRRDMDGNLILSEEVKHLRNVFNVVFNRRYCNPRSPKRVGRCQRQGEECRGYKVMWGIGTEPETEPETEKACANMLEMMAWFKRLAGESVLGETIGRFVVDYMEGGEGISVLMARYSLEGGV